MKLKYSSIYGFIILFFLIFAFVFLLAKSYSDTVFCNISNNFVRLHVVANSDSTEDQVLKYEVRDAILNYVSPYLQNAASKEEALVILNEHINDIYNVSYDVLKSHNSNLPLSVTVGNFSFPTKDYTSFVLPEGNYDALKVDIGTASGQNWWCVMFPSLCIVDTDNLQLQENSMELLKQTLNPEEFSIITKNKSSINIKIKFKLLELFENL